jgi:hypothetical protein
MKDSNWYSRCAILLFQADLLYLTVLHSDTVFKTLLEKLNKFYLYTGMCPERANVKLLFCNSASQLMWHLRLVCQEYIKAVNRVIVHQYLLVQQGLLVNYM